MKPTPKRLSPIPHHPSPIPSVVVHTELRERFRRTPFPFGDEGIADVAQVLNADPAREKARRGEVAEAVEERHARGVLRFGPLRPGDVVEHGGAFGVGAGDERLPVAIVAFVVEPGEPAAPGGREVSVVPEHEGPEPGDALSGFLSAWETNGPPSATNRFFSSCACPQRLTTDVLGSSPMRVPPSSWMIVPPAAMP